MTRYLKIGAGLALLVVGVAGLVLTPLRALEMVAQA
jgi:hypothetical protein